MNLKLVSVLSIVGLLAACGDSGSSSTGGSDTGGGGSDTGGGGNGGDGGAGPVGPVGPGGNGGEGGGVDECIDEGAAAIFPDTVMLTATAGQDVCVAAQVDDFQASCFGDAATEATCNGWFDDMANDGCRICMFGPSDGEQDDMLWPAVLFTTENLAVVNVAACEAVLAGKPECAREVLNTTFCIVTACETCEDDPSFQACLQEAAGGVCTEAAPVSANCEDVAAANSPECGGEAADFFGVMDSVVLNICGAP